MTLDDEILSRRHLLRATAAATLTTLPLWYARQSLAQQQDEQPKPTPASPTDRPGVLLIGCGGQGTGDAKGASRFGDVIACCDADEHHLGNAAQSFPKAKQYRDFREAMQHKGVDVVVNGTPDHWHTLVNLHAMRQGKDVYGEKPLTLTIDEGKHLVETWKQTKRVFQVGSQQRSDPKFRLACELVRNNRLGKLQHVLVALPSGPRAGPFKPAPVPEWLDWDLWQGQTQTTEYVPQRCHGTFRYWYDYSGGTITDWGAHHFDIAQWGLGTDRSGPTSVHGRELSSPIPGGYTTPADYWAEYEYQSGVRLTCLSTAADEGPARTRGEPRTGTLRNGVLFEGTDGWIFVTRGQLAASDESILKDPLPDNARRLYASNDHMRNFFDCARSRKPTICDAEIGHRSVTLCHLGGISMRLGRKLKWDPDNEQFVNNDEANKMLAREMRKPWGYDAV